MEFPYFAIIKKAYGITTARPWLWIFGLFIGGTSPVFMAGVNPELGELEKTFKVYQNWILQNPEWFAAGMAFLLLLFLALIVLSGLSKAAIIWATDRVAEPKKPQEEINFRGSIAKSKNFFWQIIGLQIYVTFAFLLLLALFIAPPAFLFSAGAPARATILLLLGLVIFIPASIVFGFLHLYGPIFIVLYKRSIAEAIQLSFNLLKRKLWESIILGAFLVGLNILVILVGLLGLVIWAVPISLLAFSAMALGLESAFLTITIGTILIAVLYVIVLGAGFTAFQNVTWVLAVKEMIRTQKISEEKKVLAPEPV